MAIFTKLSCARELKMTMLPSEAALQSPQTPATADEQPCGLITTVQPNEGSGTPPHLPECHMLCGSTDVLSSLQSSLQSAEQIGGSRSNGFYRSATRSSSDSNLQLSLMQLGPDDIFQNYGGRCSFTSTTSDLAGCTILDAGLLLNTDLDMCPSYGGRDDCLEDDTDMLVFDERSGCNAFLELLASDNDQQATIPASHVPAFIPKTACGAVPGAITTKEGVEEGTMCGCRGGDGALNDGWALDGFIPNQSGDSGGAFADMDKVC